jgi:hypothetical protein
LSEAALSKLAMCALTAFVRIYQFLKPLTGLLLLCVATAARQLGRQPKARRRRSERMWKATTPQR